MAAALPHRTHGVDHEFCIQIERRRHGGMAHADVTDGLSRFQQAGTRLGMDHGIRAAADDGSGICGVDDGIHTHIGNVISHDLEGHDPTSPFGLLFSHYNAKNRRMQTISFLPAFDKTSRM